MEFIVWNEVKDLLVSKIGADSVDKWFNNVDVEKEGSTLYISVFNELQAKWMDDRYTAILTDVIKNLTGETLTITYLVKNINGTYTYNAQNSQYDSSFAPVYIDENNDGHRYNNGMKESMVFNPKYTFQSYVVGSNNRFAHAAALAVADKPAQSYNPLFLYGNSGLGKTHLMHAIGHRVLENMPNTKVVYVSTESFTNDFINRVRQNMMHNFKDKYITADIFLIDDIQFLAGKKETQEAFFHIFNDLHDKGKQIVISSDRHPKDIATLEDRLRSRFEGGLITDIQPPDLETRIAILQYKASQENVQIIDEALYYIAYNIPSNIRELEGALNRVAYYASIMQTKIIDLDVAQEALRGIITENNKPSLSFESIKQAVANYYQLSISDLSSSRRDRVITKPRHIAMYLCRELLDTSLPRIGEEFGGRDHSTVIHGCDKIARDIENDVNLKQTINYLKEQLKK